MPEYEINCNSQAEERREEWSAGEDEDDKSSIIVPCGLEQGTYIQRRSRWQNEKEKFGKAVQEVDVHIDWI